MTVRLTIDVDDLDRFVVMPEHQADVRGVVVSDALGGVLAIERGMFNLFVDRDDPSDKRMLYRLWFRDGAGHRLTLDGHKIVQNHPGVDLWRDTTTLLTRILKGHVGVVGAEGGATRTLAADEAEVVASGVLRISIGQFARQLTTFRVDAPKPIDKVQALARFGRLFAGGLWDVYGRDVIYDRR